MKVYEIVNQRHPFTRLILGLGLFALILFGISSCTVPDLGEILPFNEPTEIPGEEELQATTEATQTRPVPILQSKTLIIWVPPQFDPGIENPAGELFLSRLDEFKSRRPQIEVQVRVKSTSGEYGMLESLELVSDAAPIIKPDLIALPRTIAEEAFRDGLLLPLESYPEGVEEEEMYAYARNLALVDEQIIGIPFAGDLMVLAYKNDSGEEPPPDWNAVLASGKPLAFSASDPRGLVTLANYQSMVLEDPADGDLVNLQEDALLELFKYYQSAQTANVMPYWLTQFETDQQAWQSYEDRQSTMVITWSSFVLNSETVNTSLAAIPTQDAKPFTYADGWVWCVIPSDQETELVAEELAGFLAEMEYLNSWNIESGYLPIYVSGLESWSERTNFSALKQLLPSAVLLPGNAVLDDLGPPLRDAVTGILKDQELPDVMVAALLEKIQGP